MCLTFLVQRPQWQESRSYFFAIIAIVKKYHPPSLASVLFLSSHGTANNSVPSPMNCLRYSANNPLRHVSNKIGARQGFYKKVSLGFWRIGELLQSYCTSIVVVVAPFRGPSPPLIS
eukprot:scaffold3556_cov190-Cylindrotheca_fusiformis.AAC.19